MNQEVIQTKRITMKCFRIAVISTLLLEFICIRVYFQSLCFIIWHFFNFYFKTL